MTFAIEQLRAVAEAAKQVSRSELTLVFDASRPGSRAVPEQEEFFKEIGKYQYRWIVAANQASKTSMVIREIGWLLNGDHPYGWKRPLEWGTGPLTILIVTQDRRLCELELYEGKLKPLLRDPDKWREARTGGSLQHIENRETGDRVIFLSHTDSSDRNRKHLQGFVAHYVMCDEMPASVTILEELQRRVDSRKGYFVASFTPKFRNAQIKKIVDSSVAPLAKKYTFSKFINPLFKGKEAEEHAKLAGHSQDYINAVLYGMWMQGESAIYSYNADVHGGALPEHYSRSLWRHVIVVDPASESKMGFTIFAEDPESTLWWLVHSEYVTEVRVPTEQVAYIEKRASEFNVIFRRADSAASWFIRQANAMGFKYQGVEYKNGTSKDDFIARTQQCLGVRVRIPEFNTNLVEELLAYERNPETGQIIKATKYHLIDCLHYFCHRIPAPDVTVQRAPWWQQLREANEIRERRESAPSRVHHRTNVRSASKDEMANPFLRPAPGSANSPAAAEARRDRERARHNRLWRRAR